MLKKLVISNWVVIICTATMYLFLVLFAFNHIGPVAIVMGGAIPGGVKLRRDLGAALFFARQKDRYEKNTYTGEPDA